MLSYPESIHPESKNDLTIDLFSDEKDWLAHPGHDQDQALRDLVLCTDCTSSNYTTYEADRYRPEGEIPVISVTAYLKLSAWYAVQTQPSHGGESCDQMKQVPFCVEGGSGPSGELGSALDGLASGRSPPGVSNAQSDGQRATGDALLIFTSSTEAGGVS